MSHRFESAKDLLAFLVLSALMLIVNTGSLRAQRTGSADLAGTVYDSSGAVVPGANLTVTNLDTNATFATSSNERGEYAFRFLPAGRYKLTAQLTGFVTVTVPAVTIQVSINVTLPITMRPGGISTDVTVIAQTRGIATDNATITRSLTNEQVRGLPVLTSPVGRTVLDQLPFLLPGITPSSTGAGTRGEYISINGSRDTSISFNFEGGDNNDVEFGRAASTLPNPDVLQEFTVVTNNYSADLGRSTGGVINAVAKSGTARYHGQLRYFLINEALNARCFFCDIRDRDRLNTFGGQFSGPVRIPKLYSGGDRTHFFFDYEGTRARNSNLFNRDMLTLQERDGDFSNLPASQWPIDPVTKVAFSNGKIPTDRISPISKKYLDAFIPKPNNGDRNYRDHLPYSQDNDQYSAKMDHKLSNKDSIMGTYFLTQSASLTASTTNVPIGSTQESRTTNHNFVLRETHTFSPRLANEFSATVTRYNDNFSFFSAGIVGTSPAAYGFTGVHPQSDTFLALPTVTITGTGVQVSAGTNNKSYKTTWQLKDDATWTKGRHVLKSGVELRSFIFNKKLANSNGSFNFSSANPFGSKNSIADFLLGVPNSYSQSSGTFMYPRQRAYYFYFQDDWKIHRDLTLNLGLRYELVPPVRDEANIFNVFRPGSQSQRVPGAPLGMLFYGDPDPILGTVPRGVYPTDKNNLAPRFGIAWVPRSKAPLLRHLLGDGKASLRGGYGVFFDQKYGFTFTQYGFNPPFTYSELLTNSLIAGAGGTFANPFGTLPNNWPIDLSKVKFPANPTVQPFDPSFRTAYTYQYNLTFQRELPHNLVIEIAYVGNNSFKLERQRQLNIAPVGPGSTLANVNARRIYQTLGNIYNHESSGHANYNSGQFRLTRRFTRGLVLDGSYVYSKSLDNGTSPQTSQLVSTNQFRWARSNGDRNHNFVVSYTYDLPGSQRSGLLNRLTNGWRIGGVTQYRSGLPLDLRQTVNTLLDNSSILGYGTPDLVGKWTYLDPRQVRTFVVGGVSQTGNYSFDPTALAVVPTPTDYTQARAGNLGRNVFNAPGQAMWSLSVIKQTRIRESHNFEVRADINNLFNHANFGFPQYFVSTPSTLGKILYDLGPRKIQVSARYTF